MVSNAVLEATPAAVSRGLLAQAGPPRAIAWALAVCLLAPGGPAAAQADPDPVPTSREWFKGMVLPSKQVTLIAPLDGILAELGVTEGQRVEPGTLLARMDDELQKLAVQAAEIEAEARLDLKRARLNLEEAEMNLEQVRQVYQGGAGSERELRQAQLNRDQAQAILEIAQKDQTLLEVAAQRERERLERYRLDAPFDAVVLRLSPDAEPGAKLTDETPVMTLAQLDPLEAQLYLPLELYGKLEVGRAYRLAAEAPINRELRGVLTYTEPRIDPASRTFRCVFEIDNPGAALPSGFLVELQWPADPAPPADEPVSPAG